MVKKTTKKTKPEMELVSKEILVTENEATSEIRTLNQQEVTPMVMMQMAIAEGSDVATMERLWALNEKVEAANARKAYVAAMAQFKQNPPVIEKDKLVRYQNQDGSWTEYRHASLGNVVDKITERLGRYGFSHSWNVEQVEGGQIRVTCILTHEQGHSEQVLMSSSRDDSGKKNNIQQLASTNTYLQRYTLLAVSGTATEEGDDDAQAAEPDEIIFISDNEVNELDAMLVENEISRKTFSEWLLKDMGVETLDKVPATGLARVRAAIKASIKAKKKEEK